VSRVASVPKKELLTKISVAMSVNSTLVQSEHIVFLHAAKYTNSLRCKRAVEAILKQKL
jgi:hypothetical protein